MLSKSLVVFKFGDTRWQCSSTQPSKSCLCVCVFTHIEVVRGDIHQFLVTGVESLQQHGVSSFTVQTDPTLWVTHWRWITQCDEDKILHTAPPSPSNNQTPLSQLQQMSFLHTVSGACPLMNIIWHWCMTKCCSGKADLRLTKRPITGTHVSLWECRSLFK